LSYLLDTCTFLWLISDPQALSVKAREVVGQLENELFLSVVSVWEMASKFAQGKLSFPADPYQYIPEMREKHQIRSLALDESSALQVAKLPFYHRDPFDRMLVSQGLSNNLVIISPDELVAKYPVKICW